MDKKATHSPNRLISEKSPYLLQHAYNPVDWYPWTDEAFEKAKKEDRPIFLSIGYSTCHWCHVMEKESFEDQDVADLLNKSFIYIKVDREERPDIDQVYMSVCQVLTGSGGWPLTIIMTPDKKPFFAATYIPKNSRFGRIGLMELIPKIADLWKHKRAEVLTSADKITQALKTMERVPEARPVNTELLDKAYQALRGSYDAKYGGFGDSPKFPSSHQLFFLLRYWYRTHKDHALEMVENTLSHMRRGGIYDHIGYGFHRYSTDRQWVVPHFEKMLYDQALIAMAYLEAYQATGKGEYAATAREIFRYVLRDMTSPEGGFYSAEDADSEGVEGKFYIWDKKEILNLLGEELGELVCNVYNVSEGGNFREEGSGKFTGKNILYLSQSIDSIAKGRGLRVQELQKRLDEARKILFGNREKRVRPVRDDKILADWNGLMMASLAMGGRILNDPTYLKAAEACADFILRFMQTRDGRLLHRYREGEAAIKAKLDDYAFVVWGLIELYESTFDVEYLSEAVRLNHMMLQHHWDPIKGGLFFSADDEEPLIVRKKELYDGAVPSGNSVAFMNMLRLAHITGTTALEEKAAELMKTFSGQVGQAPLAYTQFLCAVDFALGPSRELLILGLRDSEQTREMIRAAFSGFYPRMVVIFRPTDSEKAPIDSVAAYLKQYKVLKGQSTAYLCEGFTCKSPVTDPKELASMLE